MGNSQSIFYPDNEKRLKRGQELANDCQYAKQQYDASKAKIEEVLGPYKDKLDQLLRAFGCRNIDELDKLVVNSVTGQSLEYWNKVRRNYDSSSSVDQVIMGAQAVVILAGLSIGTAGTLTGSLGFFASLGSAGEVLLVITLIGAIYAVVGGSIQCDKLREAIGQSVVTRLKVKYAQRQMDHLETTVPGIKFLYQTYEELGYNKEKILNKFKDRTCLEDFKAEVTMITYTTVGQELLEMDSRRDSWTNEDPECRPIAATLDRALARESTSVVDKPAMLMSEAPDGIWNDLSELSGFPSYLARFSTSDAAATRSEASIGRVCVLS
ncbi:hypothetical protein C8Q75DRAFT_715461 [Abortiporus biennis]|nr:hypothetical protein C8Q75DRAFT_715461 [Abortiporus biennis]